MADSDSNRAAIEAFAAHFDPPLDVVATERIDGKPVAAAYMCARHLPEHEVGVTAICWGKGYFRAWAETTGTREDADPLGYVFAACLESVAQDIEDDGPGMSLAEAAATLPRQKTGESDQDYRIRLSGIGEPNPLLQRLLSRSVDSIDRSPQPYWENFKEGATAAVSENQVLPQLDTSNPDVSGQPEPLQPPSEQEVTEFQCDHDFRPNPVGTRSTCWKCGAQSPKVQIDEKSSIE